MNGVVEWASAAFGLQTGSAALVAVLIVVLSVSMATVAVCAWLELHEEAVQRTKRAAEAEEAHMARRKGGCAVRWR